MNSSLTLESLMAALGQVKRVPQLRMIESDFIVKRCQVRFPKSKKRRIRKKWANRECNWRSEPDMYQVKLENGDVTVYAHPVKAARIREVLDVKTIPGDWMIEPRPGLFSSGCGVW